MVEKQYTFSIVIPCFNEEFYIKNCLDSILNQEYDLEKIEILVVDGGSKDETLQIINNFKKRFNNIKILFNDKKITPISLNIGIKNSSNEIIIILGAHTTIDKDFLKYNNQFLNEKDAMATGGTQINVGNNLIQRLIGITMEIPFAMASAKYRWSKKENYVDTVVYAAYRREIFEKIGFFEEKITIAEDAEINWRIRQAGYKIFYSPKIKSYYYPRNSLSKFAKQMFRYGILRVNMFKKHIDALNILHLIPSMFVITFIGSLMLSFFLKPFLILLSLLIVLYLLVSSIAILLKVPSENIIYIPIFLIIIFVMHFSWGLGFIVGYITPKSKVW